MPSGVGMCFNKQRNELKENSGRKGGGGIKARFRAFGCLQNRVDAPGKKTETISRNAINKSLLSSCLLARHSHETFNTYYNETFDKSTKYGA